MKSFLNTYSSKEFKAISKPVSKSKKIRLSRSRQSDINDSPQIDQRFISSLPRVIDHSCIAKIVPKTVSHEKERLFEENISLKQMYNSILEENLKLKTKILKLNKEANEGFAESPLNKNVNLIGKLRCNVKGLKGDIKYKEKEITQLKKHIRYTRISDLENTIGLHLNDREKLEQTIKELIDQISHMVEESLYQSALDSHEQTKEVLESVNSELSSSLQTNQELLSKISDLNEDYKSQISDLISEYDSRIAVLNQEIEGHKAQIFDLNEVIEDKNCQISALNDLISQSNELNQKLSNINKEDQMTIENLQQDINQKEKLFEETLKNKEKQLEETLEDKQKTILEIQIESNQAIELVKQDWEKLLKELEQVKEAEISELNQEINSLKNIINKGSKENAFNQLVDYLVKNSISAESWVKKISAEEKLNPRELRKAFYNSDIEINEDDLKKLIQDFSEDNQIDAEDLAAKLAFKESQMTIEDMFEMFKARASLIGTRSIRKKLEKAWTEDLISKEMVEKLTESKIFTLDEGDKERFSQFFTAGQENIEKNTAVKEVLDRFSDWEGCGFSDLKGFIDKIYCFLQEHNDRVALAFQERFPMTSKIRLAEFLKMFDRLLLVSNNAERSCLRCVLFYVTGNVTKVDYLKMVCHFCERNFDDGLFSVLENKSRVKKVSPFSSGRSRKSEREERLDTPRH